ISKLEEENQDTAEDTTEETSKNTTDDKNEKDKSPVLLTNQEKEQRLRQILSTEITEDVRGDALDQLLRIPELEREEGKKIFITSFSETMENGVRTENIQSATTEVKQSIKNSDLNDDLKEALNKLSDFAVVENSFYDPDSTMEARKEASSGVEPAVIRAGEIIVREGQTITNEIYEELKLAGLLNKERNIYPIIGLIIFIILIISVIGHEMNIVAKQNKLDKGKVISI